MLVATLYLHIDWKNGHDLGQRSNEVLSGKGNKNE